MPRAPAQTEEFILSLPLAEAMQACAEAVATLGWRMIEQSTTRMKCAEVRAQAVGFTWPVQVDVALRPEPDGSTRVVMSGSAFGFGAPQPEYVREQVQTLRHTVEHTLAGRKPAAPPEVKEAPPPPSEDQRNQAVTLASELERLARLHAQGALSDPEFQQAKQRLLEQGAPQTSAGRAQAQGRRVVVNGARLDEGQLLLLEENYGLRVADGAYWYDKVSGAWGLQGGPTHGFIPASLDLGGALRADASGGNTGVYINGRELHQLDVAALRQLTPYVLPGRYWLDARGTGGYEGGPPIFDLQSLARAAGGGRGGAWSYTSRRDKGAGDGDRPGFNYLAGGDEGGTFVN